MGGDSPYAMKWRLSKIEGTTKEWARAETGGADRWVL